MGCCNCKEVKPSPIELGKGRNCTDIIPLVLFLLFWCGMILLAAFAISSGDPWRLFYGADSFGNSCGRRNQRYTKQVPDVLSGMDLRNRSYLFPMDILNPEQTVWICVESCPSIDIFGRNQLVEYTQRAGNHLCFYDVPLSSYGNATFVPESNIGPCPVLPVYKSEPVLNRCVPQLFKAGLKAAATSVFTFLNGADLYQQVLSDIVATYVEIIGLCVFALIVSLLMVFIIRYMAGIVVYVIFGIVSVAALAVTVAVWYLYFTLKFSLDTTENKTRGIEMLVSDTKNEQALLIYGIVSTLITIVIMCGVCCCWASASLVVDLFRESGRCIGKLPCLLAQPLYTTLALFGLFIGWSYVLLCIATSKELALDSVGDFWSGGLAEQRIVIFNNSLPVQWFWWYHAIGLIWGSEFILAAQQMVVAGSVATWDKSTLRFPICGSIGRSLLYHSGSLAFGSLIITLVKLPRLILMYMESKVRKYENNCVKCCARCCIGCLVCVEKCLKYLHHNAYTIIAIEGQSFCPAAKQAFTILANNALNVSTINFVGDLVLFLGKVAVTALTALAAIFVLKGKEDLHFYALPLLLVCIFAFFIAHCFLSVYEMTIDTLFLCFCADRDYADRNEGIDVFADPEFISFMRRSHQSDFRYSVSITKPAASTTSKDESIPMRSSRISDINA